MNGDLIELNYTTTLPNASLLKHALENDVGLDLTALKVHKKIGEKTTMYDTGICVQPPEGYYTEIIPRSSISKTGYMLSNSIGIVDPGYSGSLKIVLTKIVKSLLDLQVPFTVCQLILRPALNMVPIEVTKLQETSRGDRGFGSTNRN